MGAVLHISDGGEDGAAARAGSLSHGVTVALVNGPVGFTMTGALSFSVAVRSARFR
jgi:hypothetical protein